MTDARPRIPLNGKAVNLEQLAAEVGTALTASQTEVVVADLESPVTTDVLQAALDAHAPVPVPDPDAEFRAAVEAATTLSALKAALLGSKGPGAQARRPDGE